MDLGFELSNLCNLHCTHCIRGSHQAWIESLDLPFLRRIFDEADALYDELTVVFTGGEPLASDLFPAAVREVVARKIPYRFVTNGWLLPRHIELLTHYPPTFVRVSLSGGTQQSHDRQRGHGSFRRALLGVATLLAHGIRAELSMVLTRDSFSEIRDVIAIAIDLGVGELHFILPQPTPETALDGSDLSPAEWKHASTVIAAAARRSRVPVYLDYGFHFPTPRPPCDTMALRQLYIDARGRVPFCCQLSRYGTGWRGELGEEPVLGDLMLESLATVIERAKREYTNFAAETERLYQIGHRDALDDFPCVSCVRQHKRTGFLADFPEHPWTTLAHEPTGKGDTPPVSSAETCLSM